MPRVVYPLGEKWESSLTIKVSKDTSHRRKAAKEAETESRGGKVAREETGDGQGEGARIDACSCHDPYPP